MRTSPSVQPLSIADLLDTAFRLYRAHFVVFVGIAAVLLVPMALIQLIVLALFGAAALVRPLQDLLVVTVASGALTNAAAQAYLGQSPSFAAAYRLPARRYVALIVAPIALGLVVAVPLLLVFGCLFGLTIGGLSSDTGWLVFAGIAILVVLVPVLLLTLRFTLAGQAIVLEGCGALEGLRRSWQLSGGAFWRVVGVALLLGVLTYLIAEAPALGVGLLLAAGRTTEPLGSQGITIGIAQAGLILALPLQAVAYTLLYYDLRVRVEGYDLELAAQEVAQ
jgi:hypothetical protein